MITEKRFIPTPSDVMKEAWHLYKTCYNQDMPFNRRSFARELRVAWWNCHKRLVDAAMTHADKIREAIWVLECKDRWDQNDYRRMDELRAELRAAA